MLEKAELRPSSGKWIIFIVAIGSNDWRKTTPFQSLGKKAKNARTMIT
jgi:hypothetical protein